METGTISIIKSLKPTPAINLILDFASEMARRGWSGKVGNAGVSLGRSQDDDRFVTARPVKSDPQNRTVEIHVRLSSWNSTSIAEEVFISGTSTPQRIVNWLAKPLDGPTPVLPWMTKHGMVRFWNARRFATKYDANQFAARHGYEGSVELVYFDWAKKDGRNWKNLWALRWPSHRLPKNLDTAKYEMFVG